MPLFIAQLLSFLFLAVSCNTAPKVPTGSQEWRICQQEEDCMELRGYCNSPLAINKKYEDTYRAFKRNTEKSIACENFDIDEWPEVYKVTCKEQMCRLSPLDDSSAPKSKKPFPKIQKN